MSSLLETYTLRRDRTAFPRREPTVSRRRDGLVWEKVRRSSNSLFLYRSHDRGVVTRAPVLERAVVQAWLETHVFRGEEQQARLLADVTIRHDAIVRLDVSCGEHAR